MSQGRPAEASSLAHYELANVESVTDSGGRDVVISQGSYGRILKVMVSGALCAAKEIHSVFNNQPNHHALTGFERECELMSIMRHPNVVQFLGLHRPRTESGNRDPPYWLIMEYLPIELHHLLEPDPPKQPAAIPNSVCVSILQDIVAGLSYLHNTTALQQIIHRDLTARNVLLTSGLIAKIADFGVSRQRTFDATKLTLNTGNPLYMPPENQDQSKRYTSKMDIFSFGVILLFVICRSYPKDLEQIQIYENNQIIRARSEVQRRQKYFDLVEGTTDPTVMALVELCKECLSDLPTGRPSTNQLCERINRLTGGTELEKYQVLMRLYEQDPRGQAAAAGANGHREEMARLTADMGRLWQQLAREEREKSELEQDLTQLREECASKDAEKSELQRLFSQTDTLRRALQDQLTQLTAEKERLEGEVSHKTWQLTEKERALTREKEITDNYQRIIDMSSADESLRQQLQEVIDNLQTAQGERDRLDRELQMVSKQLADKEIELGRLVLELKRAEEDTISAQQRADNYKEQLEKKANEPPKIQDLLPPLPPSGLRASLELNCIRGDNAPVGLHSPHCVLYNNTVLVGGAFQSQEGNHQRSIFSYDPSMNRWAEFAKHPHSLIYFTMVVISNRLFLVGGFNPSKNEYSNAVLEYMDGRGFKTFCHLPFPRAGAAVFGYRNWLIVAGGCTIGAESITNVDAIDVTKPGSGWKPLPPLPIKGHNFQMASYTSLAKRAQEKDLCLVYLTHSKTGVSVSSQQPTVAVSVPDLLRGGQWVPIPDPPVRSPAVVTIRGHLVALGGTDAKRFLNSKVYMYHHGTTEWLAVGEIPNPRRLATCVALSEVKFLLLAGRDKSSEYSRLVETYNLPTN